MDENTPGVQPEATPAAHAGQHKAIVAGAVTPAVDKQVGEVFRQLGFGNGHGFLRTALPGVTLFRFGRHEASCPQHYERGIVFVLQGHKEGRLNDMHIRTSSERFTILTDAYPVHCETFASNPLPVLGVHIHLDIVPLRQLAAVTAKYDQQECGASPEERVLTSIPLTTDILAEVHNLLALLPDSGDCAAVGEATLTRLYYAVLKSPAGVVLRALARADSKLSRVSGAILYMQQNYDRKITVNDIASHLGLGESTLNRAFRIATGESPIQYLRKVRLTRARSLITLQRMPVQQVAGEVGYRSSSQFSRDFRNYFGVPPGAADSLPYGSVSVIGDT
ncbi:helix-turn-helix transcriptional regulator [Microbulbifer hainanensis]|uniref:helix-turn-helix transcriptional regulator n=1 Tax=Microbulbifer hainanensis TaxID=2735675 RepID=UPI001868E68B|nr:helix-turn-helix domain-containing protein [Microbulbifer hainanensis]